MLWAVDGDLAIALGDGLSVSDACTISYLVAISKALTFRISVKVYTPPASSVQVGREFVIASNCDRD